jgi:hypothetical protein
MAVPYKTLLVMTSESVFINRLISLIFYPNLCNLRHLWIISDNVY